MKDRYKRTLGCVSEDELRLLQSKRVGVVGCGGLGCYIIEELSRMGVGQLLIADGDCFELSNLNRQLYATGETLGLGKAVSAAERVSIVNPEVSVLAINTPINEGNAKAVLRGCDLIVDALDSASDRRMLAQACAELSLPLIHGAISGWRAQVSVLLPGSKAFDFIYPPDWEDTPSSPSLPFTPAVCASIEAAEAVKVLLGREKTLAGRLLILDLLTNDFNIINL